MGADVDNATQAPGAGAMIEVARTVEQRRPGRRTRASAALIPILRGMPPDDGEDAPIPAKPEALPDRGPARRGCAACQDPAALFAFTMAFQPIVDLQNSRIDAYEALVRGPEGQGAGHVLGQVTPANTYAFDQACRVKAIEMAARLGIDRQLSINFLPNAVYEPRACIQTTLQAAARTGFPRDRLTFEILESETITDAPHLAAIIREYRKQGFKIALDDFGTGYSGLARLAELKPDIVKVDRILAQDCDKDRARLAIVAAVIALGLEIGVKVVVEGVERVEEVAALRSVGARFIQGFYFAKPAFEAVVQDSDIGWPGAR